MPDALLHGRTDDVAGAADVDLEQLLPRAADRRSRCRVHDGVTTSQRLSHTRRVSDIALEQLRCRCVQLCIPAAGLVYAAHQQPDLVTVRLQPARNVGTDKARSTRHQNLHA